MVRRKRQASYLTSGQLAEALGVSRSAVTRWIQQGEIKGAQTPGGHFRIPVAEFERFRSAYRFVPAHEESPGILIVDDEPTVVDLLVDGLRGDARGFKLETATDGYEALIKIGSFKPWIVILDVVMPRLDGVEVCRRLKANPETRDIKILGVTGYPDRIPALLEAGADACITKPMDLAHVRQELERLLGTRQ